MTTSEVRSSDAVRVTPQGEPSQREMALGLRYLSALEAAGAIPVVVPPLQRAPASALLDKVAGVCLSGGPDLDPVAYGQRTHAKAGPMWQELDAFELELARAADARQLPVLAVCRGLQVLNVARGGTLHQHLPDVVGETINHRQSQTGDQTTHSVTLEPHSKVSRIIGATEAKVNSFHHQAVATLGQGLIVTGHADDGTIESLEATDREFMLGVQWHAECLADRAEHAALFSALVDAVRRHELARRVPLAA